jgi:hypothetical protein
MEADVMPLWVGNWLGPCTCSGSTAPPPADVFASRPSRLPTGTQHASGIKLPGCNTRSNVAGAAATGMSVELVGLTCHCAEEANDWSRRYSTRLLRGGTRGSTSAGMSDLSGVAKRVAGDPVRAAGTPGL